MLVEFIAAVTISLIGGAIFTWFILDTAWKNFIMILTESYQEEIDRLNGVIKELEELKK